MPDYRKEAARIAREIGVPVDLYLRLVRQESGFNPKAVSRSGAIGLAQLMPGTAQGLGVDPFDPIQNLTGGARYLKTQFDKFGRWDLALAACNAGPGAVAKYGGVPPYKETQNYVKKIAGGTLGGATVKTPAVTVDPTSPLGTTAMPSLSPAVTGILDRNAALLGMPSIAPLLTKFTAPTVPSLAAAAPVAAAGALPQGTADWQKYVGKITHRQGPSAPHQPAILQFVGRVGQLAGTVLTPWGNESHSLTTVNGKRSAHGSGMAADIPAVGAENIRLGRAALVAAGMSPAEAAKAKPGLYNLAGHQIIFGVNGPQYGGNHLDHVHVGLRG